MYNLPKPIIIKKEKIEIFNPLKTINIKEEYVFEKEDNEDLEISTYKDLIAEFSKNKNISLINIYDKYIYNLKYTLKQNKKKLEYCDFRERIINFSKLENENNTYSIVDECLKNEVFFPVWESLFK